MLNNTGPMRGRGAGGNPANRFDAIAYEQDEYIEDDEIRRPDTQFIPDHAKSVLNKVDSPDIPFRRSLNPYRGCEHGCVYCYARPMHEYVGLSAGLDFETKILVKENAPELLRAELTRPRWEPQVVALSGATDCYQPIEKKLRLTRRCLEVFAEFRNPVGLITKNRLVTRDIDVLQKLAEHDAVSVFISLTTLDTRLNRIMEPRTSLPKQRLDAIRTLTDAGIPTGVMTAPIVPGLNDHEVPMLIEAAVEAGARFAGYVTLRLPHAVAPLFEQWLENHLPDRKDKILNRVRAVRGGKLNDSQFGSRMRGQGFHADQISTLFRVACQHAGIADQQPPLSAAAFRRPQRGQLRLFE
jgi:DNA repair photolyase